jgi:uncharacterized SAM-binding protein YcdF (DUF218 family)
LSPARSRNAATPRRQPHHRPPFRRARRSWKFKLACAAVACILILFLWGLLARHFAPAGNTAIDRFDAIIVLGNPADSDGNPTPTQLARVTEAVHEYERGVAPRLILTGGPAANQYVEARVMARTAEAQGIPESAIFVEPEAKDTIQNACYSVRIMKAHGWNSAEVVSSPSHLPRAGLIFSRLPLQWRTHAAPPLARESALQYRAATTLEIFKTTRYLVWARQVEQCQP